MIQRLVLPRRLDDHERAGAFVKQVESEQIKIFVVSGAQSLERRQFMRRQLDSMGIEFEFHDAYFPESIPQMQHAENLLFAKRINGKAEYGCARSHQNVYLQLLDRDIPLAVVLEDDAELSQDFLHILRLLPSLTFDVCMLGQSKLTRDQYRNAEYYFPLYERRRLGKWKVGKSLSSRYGTVGYAVSKRGAQKLLRANPRCELVADNWSYFEIAHDFTLDEIRPLVVFEDCITHGSHIDEERGGKQVDHIVRTNAMAVSRLYQFFKALKAHLRLWIFLLKGRSDRRQRSWKE